MLPASAGADIEVALRVEGNPPAVDVYRIVYVDGDVTRELGRLKIGEVQTFPIDCAEGVRIRAITDDPFYSYPERPCTPPPVELVSEEMGYITAMFDSASDRVTYASLVRRALSATNPAAQLEARRTTALASKTISSRTTEQEEASAEADEAAAREEDEMTQQADLAQAMANRELFSMEMDGVQLWSALSSRDYARASELARDAADNAADPALADALRLLALDTAFRAAGLDPDDPEGPLITVQGNGYALTPLGQFAAAAHYDGTTYLTLDNPFSRMADMEVGDLVGMQVVDADGEIIGDLDGVMQNDGELAAVVEVGGFLGLGNRQVALPLDELESDGERVQLRAIDTYELEATPENQFTMGETLDPGRTLRDAIQGAAPLVAR
ncbi:PRC-barrel domain-containing protein [Roseitranquillus sediminis]|uniref:PRC-barrel domain-containing protein n=1 Tax=Roseitranquillus sediminis TaxID=2809051 RepID=UPI001D0C4088|nr:PRC-barrel domain-containing protein [Roseitranquillus sediminis]MBM9594250.1 PRC-barrel domain-containing protein [Roseitranquillus sediminis]